MNKVKFFFLTMRPKTLLAAFVPVFLGTVFAVYEGALFNRLFFFCALSSALLIQISTNFFNDAVDFKKGSDGPERKGPPRAAQSGWFSYAELMLWASFFALLAVVVSMPIYAAFGIHFFFLAVISVFFAFSYTGGPFPLAYNALGELFVFIFFGLVATLGSFYLQSQVIDFEIFLLASQVGLFSCVLIAINNLRDLEEDRSNNKKTLAVFLNELPFRWLCSLFILMAYFLNLFWMAKKVEFLIVLLACLPISFYLLYHLNFSKKTKQYNHYLALSALQLLIFAISFVVALWV